VQDLEKRIKDRLQEFKDLFSGTWDQVKDDLCFESGNQWDKDIADKRGSRPMPVLNETKKYIDRIVNPLIQSPDKVTVEGKDPFADALSPFLNEKLKEVIEGDSGREAISIGWRTSVGTGYGFANVGTKYKNNRDYEQCIKIDTIVDPTAVFYDISPESVNGDTAMYGGVFRYLDEQWAKDVHGDDVLVKEWDDSMYSSYEYKEHKVPELVYYEKRLKRMKRVKIDNKSKLFTEDEYNELPELPKGTKSRTVEQTEIYCCKYIGAKKIEETKLDCNFIPLVPIYGDDLYDKDKSRKSGVVHIVRDAQRSVNYYLASEHELAALAPKAPWIMAKGQQEGVEGMWKTANTKAWDTLYYEPKVHNGVLLPPPVRNDNTAQTGPLIQSRQKATEDIGSQLGIDPVSFGTLQGANQSGKSVLLQQSASDVSTAHYSDNREKSVKQMARITVELALALAVEPIQVTVEDENGNKAEMMVIPAELGLDSSDFNFDVVQGPASESKRRENLGVMLDLYQLAPEKMGMAIDLIVKDVNTAGSKEIYERLEKMVPPELKDQEEEAPDPQAMMALQNAEQLANEQAQMIEYLNGVISQLQAQFIDDSADREADLVKNTQDNVTKLEVEAMKQEGANQREAAKIAADAEKKIIDLADKASDQEREDVKEIVQQAAESKRFIARAPGPVEATGVEPATPSE
jgi:hypothetical protein